MESAGQCGTSGASSESDSVTERPAHLSAAPTAQHALGDCHRAHLRGPPADHFSNRPQAERWLGSPNHSLAHCYGALYWKALRQNPHPGQQG